MAWPCWHKWTRWEQYNHRYTVGGEEIVYLELRQKRNCEKCGRRQDDVIMKGD